ncbi:MAG: AmmeMemoRadiSam system protein B [Candidatus Atribacteria bacterium]|nr:AmmeMemoRadiSam system protein B [Candidatus Atribacteria bacterium]
MERLPAVAGYFYPENKNELANLIQKVFESEIGAAGKIDQDFPTTINGVVCPHAGIIFSGAVASWAYAVLSLTDPIDTFIIIGPNHRGLGRRASLSSAESWITPLGKVEVDQEAVNFLISASSIFSIDDRAHQYEHSCEIQIPFLQYFIPFSFKICPISLLDQTFEAAKEMSQAIIKLSQKKKIVIIASTDFTHYESDTVAREKDLICIDNIIRLDGEEFFHCIHRNQISICGPGGVGTLIEFQKNRHSSRGNLLCYATSGDINGQYDQVVGYAAIAFPQ